jgi:hypothetical protein
VTALVSLSQYCLRFAADADESPPALIDADELAYEDAVQGGGVCYIRLKLVAYELICPSAPSFSCTGLEFPTQTHAAT